MKLYHRLMAAYWRRIACARLRTCPFVSVMDAVRAMAYHKSLA